MLIIICVFYLGCLSGSFLYCIAGLWTRHKFHLLARSKCDYCQSSLRWYELLPIISYFLQRGKCRQCRHTLSVSYLLSEVFSGCLFLHTFFFFTYPPLHSLPTYLILLLMSFCDLCERWVPDTLQVCLFIWLLYLFAWYQHDIILFLFNCALFGCFSLAFYFLRHNWIGGADIKLLLILQFALPVTQFPLFLFIAASLGLVFYFIRSCLTKDQTQEIPFIPFISLSFYIVSLYF